MDGNTETIAGRRQLELLRSPRWRAMSRVLGWFREPLAAEDGCPPEELAAIERRLGAPLPRALGEWFELLGRRLAACGEQPATPGSLALSEEDGTFLAWSDDQGVMQLWSPPGDDPVAVALLEDAALPAAPLSAWLCGLTIRSVTTAVQEKRGRSVLGALHPALRGGVLERCEARQRARLEARYGELPLPALPEPGPLRGDEHTVIRSYEYPDGSGVVWWLTSSPEAFARIRE